jgi:anti-sigma B factor antagonist
MSTARTLPAGSVPVAGFPPDDPLLRVWIERPRRSAVIATVEGEIDLHSAPHLRAAIAAPLGDTAGTFVIDLCRVRFLGAAGITALVRAQRHIEARHWRLRLVTGSPCVEGLLLLPELNMRLSVRNNLEQALNR